MSSTGLTWVTDGHVWRWSGRTESGPRLCSLAVLRVVNVNRRRRVLARSSITTESVSQRLSASEVMFSIIVQQCSSSVILSCLQVAVLSKVLLLINTLPLPLTFNSATMSCLRNCFHVFSSQHGGFCGRPYYPAWQLYLPSSSEVHDKLSVSTEIYLWFPDAIIV